MGRYTSKETTSSYLSLDIRYLRRQDLLRPRGWFTLTWSRSGEVVSSVRIRAEFDRIVLNYRHQKQGGDWTPREYPVFLVATPCNYGGERRWFICPGSGCARRIAVLYCGSVFACRHCYKLSYESQREAPYSRALSKAQAIRTKLGGSANMSESFPERPRGMHHETYWRLIQEYENAQTHSWPPWLLRRLGL